MENNASVSLALKSYADESKQIWQINGTIPVITERATRVLQYVATVTAWTIITQFIVYHIEGKGFFVWLQASIKM